MGKVAIVTDSAACVPVELQQRYGIRVVPFRLVWGDQAYRDGVDVTTAEFYQRLRTATELPITSQPNVGDFVSVYKDLVGRADSVVSIHLPASLSGAVQSAQLALEMVPELPVSVFDCGTAAIAEGFVVLAAARAADQGASQEQVLRVAQDLAPKVRLQAMLESLHYLARGGRVPAILALVGSALQIKPVLDVGRGQVVVGAKPRTLQRAIRRMLSDMAAYIGDAPVHAAVLHADVPEEAEVLRGKVAARFHCVELFMTEFTPVMGAHTGPDVIGLAYYPEESASGGQT